MTSRERMCKVLNREVPDRVPTFEYLIHHNLIDAICPGGNYSDVVETLDLDAITAWSAETLSTQAQHLEVGDIFVDEWGVKTKKTSEMALYPLEEDVPIQSMSDLSSYRPPNPLSETRYADLREYVRRFRGEKLVSYGILDAFENTKYLLGLQNFLLAFHHRTDLLRAVYDMTTEWAIDVATKAVDIGADMIIYAGDLGYKNGPWFMPKIMEEIHIPSLKRVSDAVKKRRGYFFYHSHGNIWSLLDMIVNTGIDVIHPMSPECMMDITIAKRVFGSRVVVAGNISTDLLSRGSRQEVIKVTRETIENTKAGGGYILTASSSIPSAVRPENYRAMVETCHEFGRY